MQRACFANKLHLFVPFTDTPWIIYLSPSKCCWKVSLHNTSFHFIPSLSIPPLPSPQWYPGHIAKAERDLKEQLKLVDVVVEVRDARCPAATTHPDVSEASGSAGHRHCLLSATRACDPRTVKREVQRVPLMRSLSAGSVAPTLFPCLASVWV